MVRFVYNTIDTFKYVSLLLMLNAILVSSNIDFTGTVIEEYFEEGDTIPSILNEGYCKKFLLNGQTISREDAPNLFYKKKWGLTKKLQDRSGRVLVQVGKGNGLTERHIGDVFGSESQNIQLANLPRLDYGLFLANDGTGIGLQSSGWGTKVNYNRRLVIEGQSKPITNASPSIVVAWYLIGC